MHDLCSSCPQSVQQECQHRLLKRFESMQVDQLADMISTVFMVHSGSNLQTFSHLNTSLVVTAAEMACQTFFSQASFLEANQLSC